MDNTTEYYSNGIFVSPAYGDFVAQNSSVRKFGLIRDAFSYIQIPTGVLICILNTFILVCFIKFEFLRRKANVYLFSVCISDLLAGMTCISVPTTSLALKMGTYTPFLKYLCIISGVLQYFTFASSFYSMVTATIERYVHIVHPFLHARYSMSNIHLVIIGTGWLIYFGLMFFLGIPNNWRPGLPCYIGAISKPLAYMILVPASTLPQMAIISVLMIKILQVTRRHVRQIQTQIVLPVIQAPHSGTGTTSKANTTSMRARTPGKHAHTPGLNTSINRRRTKMVVVMIIATLICWTPVTLALVLRAALPVTLTIDTTSWVIFAEISIILVIMNSLVNPILFHMFSPDIRRAFRMIFNQVQPAQIADDRSSIQLPIIPMTASSVS